jgi:hypothetical protein
MKIIKKFTTYPLRIPTGTYEKLRKEAFKKRQSINSLIVEEIFNKYK